MQSYTVENRDEWNQALAKLPYAHILQSWEWGAFKAETTGWIPKRIMLKEGNEIVAMASIGMRRVAGFPLLYLAKGPAFAYEDGALVNEVLSFIEDYAKEMGAIWVKIDPDVVEARGTGIDDDNQADITGETVKQILKARKWQYSADQVQFKNTLKIDLTQDEETILMMMSQNTRRKVRTAEKKGVTVRQGDIQDLEILFQLYQTTGERDDFLIRPFEYYRKAWQVFMEAGLAKAFIAEFEEKAIAHVILFHFGQTCWYFYGASSNEERNRMPNYLLQWEAMRWAKQAGYRYYDMWGAPTVFDESDSMWGVYQFKQGFRAEVVRHIGAWDFAPSTLKYKAYTQLRPRVYQILKRLKG